MKPSGLLLCKKLMLAGAAFALVGAMSVRADPVAKINLASGQTKAGSILANKKFTEISNAFSAGIWLKNPAAQWHTHFLYNDKWSLTFPNTEEFVFSVVQVDAVGKTNRTVKLSVPSTSPCYHKRWTWASDNTWHFFAVTFSYDANDAENRFQRLYVDGNLVAETATSYGPVAAPSVGILSGSSIDTNGVVEWSFTKGSFADLMVFKRALSTEEVGSLYSAKRRLSGDEEGLILYYPLGADTNYCRNGARGSNGLPAATFKTQLGGTWTFDEDDTLPLTGFGRCVASPQWVAEHGYVQAANATFHSWDDPATNIQDAVDVAFAGEPVRVMSGTYAISRQIAVSNKLAFVTSCDPETGKTDRNGTVIDCGGVCRGFYIGKGSTDDNIEVRGFTVKNGGSVNSGGGVYLNGGASSLANLSKRCRLVDCTITNCTATANGGGVCAVWGLVTNCLMTGCTANLGGGMCNSRAVQYADARANAHQIGVADDCDFVGNTASNYGGGYGNSTDYQWHTMYVRNCRFRNNKATNRGGHIDAGAGSRVEGCTFSGSAAASYGCCMNFGSGDSSKCPPLVTNCLFIGATSGGGFGYLHPSTNMKILDCVVSNNSYATAFVFNESGARIVVRHCLFADNKNSTVVQSHNATSTFIENCTVAMTGAMKGTSASTSKDIFVNCILGGTVTSSASHQAIVSNCVVQALGGTPHAANSNVYVGRNPGFKDAANGDYTLKDGAFARDKGFKLDWMTDTSVDFAGNPRLVNRGGIAYAADALPDLGCFEAQTPVPGMLLLFR